MHFQCVSNLDACYVHQRRCIFENDHNLLPGDLYQHFQHFHVHPILVLVMCINVDRPGFITCLGLTRKYVNWPQQDSSCQKVLLLTFIEDTYESQVKSSHVRKSIFLKYSSCQNTHGRLISEFLVVRAFNPFPFRPDIKLFSR